jgi:hypothetical protein
MGTGERAEYVKTEEYTHLTRNRTRETALSGETWINKAKGKMLPARKRHGTKA